MLKNCKKCRKLFETEKDHLLCHSCWMSEIEKVGGMTDDAQLKMSNLSKEQQVEKAVQTLKQRPIVRIAASNTMTMVRMAKADMRYGYISDEELR